MFNVCVHRSGDERPHVHKLAASHFHWESKCIYAVCVVISIFLICEVTALLRHLQYINLHVYFTYGTRLQWFKGKTELKKLQKLQWEQHTRGLWFNGNVNSDDARRVYQWSGISSLFHCFKIRECARKHEIEAAPQAQIFIRGKKIPRPKLVIFDRTLQFLLPRNRKEKAVKTRTHTLLNWLPTTRQSPLIPAAWFVETINTQMSTSTHHKVYNVMGSISTSMYNYVDEIRPEMR